MFEELPQLPRVAVPVSTPPQQCTKAPVFPHPAPELLLSVSKIRAMLLREMGYWVMVFICSSLMTGEGQTSFHVFIDHLDAFSGEMSIQEFFT